MSNILNKTTSGQLMNNAIKYTNLADELRKKGYIRESQNMMAAVRSMEKASDLLGKRYEPMTQALILQKRLTKAKKSI